MRLQELAIKITSEVPSPLYTKRLGQIRGQNDWEKKGVWATKVLIATNNFNLENLLRTVNKLLKYVVHVPLFGSPAKQSNKEVWFSRSSCPCDLEAKKTSISFLEIVKNYWPKGRSIVLLIDLIVNKRGNYPPLHAEVNGYFSILNKKQHFKFSILFQPYPCHLQLQMLILQFEFNFRNTLPACFLDCTLHVFVN